MKRFQNWLRETHGPVFELVRHFLWRFFDSDLVTAPGQMTAVLIGAIPVVFQWFFLLIAPLKHKYADLSRLPAPGPYREAVLADELWLLTLMMSIIGLLTAVKWHFLFPDLRDYRALAALPVRPREIFGAKLIALILIAAALLAVVNFLPAVGFPALSASRWSIQPSLGTCIRAHTVASVAGCGFLFFGLIGLQGVALNVLRPRTFGRVSGYLQGALVAAMLSLVVLSFSIGPPVTAVVLQPEWARLLPPVWFLGVYQNLLGDPAPAMLILAHQACLALASAVVLALATYLVSYRRHRTLLLEWLAGKGNRRRGGEMLARLLSGRPRQQAVLAFMLDTFARSNQHRTIVMGYAGLAFALLLTGVAGMGSVFKPHMVIAADFVYYHVLALVFLLLAARQIFSFPVELKANWIFQITEGEGRVEWLRAIDRFVFCWGVLVMFALPLPLELRLLGWRTLAEIALLAAMGLLTYEWVFSSWNKLPFTCSHLPGKTPAGMVLAFFGLLGALAGIHSTLLAILFYTPAHCVITPVLMIGWIRVRRTRRQGWATLRLKYQDLREPAVHALNLLR
jgi:hypothetical protein